jgi:hypothetical protein
MIKSKPVLHKVTIPKIGLSSLVYGNMMFKTTHGWIRIYINYADLYLSYVMSFRVNLDKVNRDFLFDLSLSGV